MTLKNLSMLEITRPPLNIMGIMMAASGAALALTQLSSRESPWAQIILGIIAVFTSVGSMHTFNDYIDRIRDVNIWPSRPLPSGRLQPREALMLAIAFLSLGLVIALIDFNPTCFLIMLVTAIGGLIYSKWLRNRIGYLSLPVIVGLIPVGGFAAFAPSLVLSDKAIWVIYIILVLWQAGHILVYSPVHGVTASEVGPRTAVPTFIKPLTPKGTAKLATFFFICLLGINAYFYRIALMSPIYMLITSAFGIFVISSGLRLIRDPSAENSVRAFKLASTYALVLCLAITLDLLVRLYIL
jgi:4-hydroxybenzoate polyprenyltransferase